jgi:hypothetical protein
MKTRLKLALISAFVIATSITEARAGTPASNDCKPPSLCVTIEHFPPVTLASFVGYCVAVVGPLYDTSNESIASSVAHTELSWAALINDCYSHAQSIITESKDIQTCTQQAQSQNIYAPACGINEYLVSGGVAYDVAYYDGLAPSLTGLTEVSPAPTQSTGGLSGLCEVTYSYLGFEGALETGVTYNFINATTPSDSSLETNCNSSILSELNYETAGGSFFNPKETLTDLSSGATLIDNPFVPSGETLTGLCSWKVNAGPASDPSLNSIVYGGQTVWGTTDQELLAECESHIDGSIYESNGGKWVMEYPSSYSLIDQTTGTTLFSCNLTASNPSGGSQCNVLISAAQ